MKLCITGKGGCGKSVVTTLLARSLSEKGRAVLVVDADESNLGLSRMLGLPSSPTLMAGLGGKQGVKNKLNQSVKIGGPQDKSGARIFSADRLKLSDIPRESISSKGNIRLLQVGKIEHAHEGCACMMGILGREFLSKLEIGSEESVLVDMEAGVEHFGRGVESGADAVMAVVDPSFESVLMAEKVSGLTRELGKTLLVVLNKVTEDVEGPLRDELDARGLSVTATLYNDPEIFKACLGGKEVSSQTVEQELARSVESLF